jgi:hypothetical protein
MRNITLQLLLLLCCALLSCSYRYSFTQVQQPQRDEAVLVLTGLRNSAKGMRHMRRWYPGLGRDVFIPPFYSKDGLADSAAKLNKFIEDNNLRRYERLQAVAYLLGGRVLNMYLSQVELPNLTHIIYDRSPYQEQAPRIVQENMPRLARALFGVTFAEFAGAPYLPLPKGGRKIGIMVECRATPYVRRHRDQLTPVSADDFLPAAFNQEHDDIFYVYRHHDEMYYSFEAIGPEIGMFFDQGRFTSTAQRRPCRRNPFE